MASIHDLCNPEPEENSSYHSPTLPDYPPGPHPHPHPHHPASYQHGPPPHHYPRYNSEYAEPPPPPPHSSRSHRGSHPHDRHPQHYPPHYKPYPPPPPHLAPSPQPYPLGPHAPSHPHHRPSSHHYHDQPPPHPSAYEGRHGYDPQYPPRPHSPPPHPSMSGVPHPYDHYPPGPPPPPHHRSQRGYHLERPRNHSRDHAREHSREHPRDHHPRDQYEQYPSNHHPAPNTRALAPTTSASTGVPPAPGSASNGATNPHPEHRAVKTEHAHQEALRRNAALLDERPAKIKIVQQPLHARMCGFGEKDRRPVDPPPIVQLILDEDHEQHPTKRMQRNAAKKAAGDSKDKPEDNKEGENGGKEGEDETDQLEEDGNEEKQPDGTATGKTAAKGKAGSLQKQDSQDAASGAGSSPSLGKRSRPSSNSKSKAKRSGTADDGDDGDGEKSHSDHSQSGSDDEGDDDNNQHTNGNLQEQDPLFVLHVSLWSADGKEVRNMIATPGQSEPPKLTRILMGSLVVSPILLNNPEGVPGWYFSFPDLSIRTEGVYTLKFSLMRFGSFDFMSNDGGHASTLVAEEISEPFTVFSAKKFPGMTESTELSKAFAKQGLKIPIRNDLRARKADRDN